MVFQEIFGILCGKVWVTYGNMYWAWKLPWLGKFAALKDLFYHP